MSDIVAKLKRWKEDPVAFVRDNFGIEPDPWQVDALTAIGGQTKTRRRLVMKACTGPGKSAVLAWIGWHRLFCFGLPGEHPKGAALSGEGRDNLQDNLWAELAKWQARSPLLMSEFVWTKSQIYARRYEKTWFLSARSYPKDANAESIGQSLSGLHSKFSFILLDETGGMPATVGQKAEQIFTGGVIDALIAQAGNPTSTEGLLYASCNDSHDATVITITADPNDPKRTTRVDPEHAADMIKKYGRDNAWVKATILGEFPETGINTLLGIDEVEASMNRFLREEDYVHAQKRLGVDVARFGMDATMIAPRQGLRAFNPVEMRGARTNEIAARVMIAKNKWKSEVEYVDDTGGWGSGVVDSLMQAGQTPFAVNFAGKAMSSKYLNCRAEMWFTMADWVKRGGQLPNDRSFIKQFTAPTYTFSNGKFQLEPKEQIKKRLGFSPDYADALAMTFYHPDIPAGEVVPANLRSALGATNYESDWNPFDDSRQ